MKIFNSLSEINSVKNTAIALGAFDGLHLGHKSVIDEVLKSEYNSSVFTFVENPSKKLTGKTEYLLGEKQKEEVLSQWGIKNYFCIDFSEIMEMAPETFVEDLLIKKLDARLVSCGKDFRFGKNAKGDVELLEKICSANGVRLVVVEDLCLNGERISSNNIRNAIKNGDMKSACEMLGRYYTFTLPVVEGNRIGRTLGAPTMNQKMPEGFSLPKFGVYASNVIIDGKNYYGVTNIGTKPSIGKYDPLAETFIPDINMDLYTKEIKIEVIEFIRAEKKFNSLEELKNEIGKNAKTAKEIYSKNFR